MTSQIGMQERDRLLDSGESIGRGQALERLHETIESGERLVVLSPQLLYGIDDSNVQRKSPSSG